jgi:hypothetical protein
MRHDLPRVRVERGGYVSTCRPGSAFGFGVALTKDQPRLRGQPPPAEATEKGPVLTL